MSNELQEIQRSLGRLEGKVEEGFRGVHQRQDTTNGNIASHSKRIKRLEGRVDWDEVKANRSKIDDIEAFINNLKGRLTVWAVLGGTVMSLVIFGVQELVRRLFLK